MDYSKLLGRIREKGCTQESLAAKIGVSATTLNKKLRGHTSFTQKEIASICEVLDLSGEDISTYFFTPVLKKT